MNQSEKKQVSNNKIRPELVEFGEVVVVYWIRVFF